MWSLLLLEVYARLNDWFDGWVRYGLGSALLLLLNSGILFLLRVFFFACFRARCTTYQCCSLCLVMFFIIIVVSQAMSTASSFSLHLLERLRGNRPSYGTSPPNLVPVSFVIRHHFILQSHLL